MNELKRSKKICILTPLASVGGAERVAVNLANYYSQVGHQVTLLTFKGIGFYRNQIDDSVTIIDLQAHKIRYIIVKLISTLKSIQADSILSVIRDGNISLGLASFFLQKNYTLVFREANTMDEVWTMKQPKRSLYKMLMRIAYHNADMIIANSNGTANDLLNNKITINDKISIIDNPVLPQNFKELAESKLNHYWLTSNFYKTVITVGRLHPQKNHLLLIDAFSKVQKEIDNLRLIILGEGKEKNKIKQKIKELNIENYIEFINFQENPYPYYKHADIFVLSSLWEGFGNVLVEALACGTPVISTDCPGGPRKILDHGKYGKLIPINDSEAMAEAIRNTLINPYNNKDLRIERAKQFSIENIGDKYMFYL